VDAGADGAAGTSADGADTAGVVGRAEEEAGAVEVDVGQEERHGPALGDVPGFVEVALRTVGAGEGVCRTTFLPGAGHMFFYDRWPDILRQLLAAGFG
jgi:hypothetical protein